MSHIVCQTCKHAFDCDEELETIDCPRCGEKLKIQKAPPPVQEAIKGPPPLLPMVLRPAQISDDRKEVMDGSAMKVVITGIDIPASTVIAITLIVFLTMLGVAAVIGFLWGIVHGLL